MIYTFDRGEPLCTQATREYNIQRTNTHELLLLRFHMKIADATAHVTAPNARYRFKLS